MVSFFVVFMLLLKKNLNKQNLLFQLLVINI